MGKARSRGLPPCASFLQLSRRRNSLRSEFSSVLNTLRLSTNCSPKLQSHRLTVAAERQVVVLAPSRALGRARLGEVVALAVQAAVLAAGRGKTAHFAVLVDRVADPVDARIVADNLVHRVNHDHLVVLVHGILVQPVRVQHAQGAAATRGALLGDRLQVASKLELGDTAVHRLTVHLTLVDRALAATAANTRAVDDKALLRLVTQAARLVRARRARHAADGRQLAVLPHADTLQEAHHIGLLLLPQLFDILVSLRNRGENGRKQSSVIEVIVHLGSAHSLGLFPSITIARVVPTRATSSVHRTPFRWIRNIPTPRFPSSTRVVVASIGARRRRIDPYPSNRALAHAEVSDRWMMRRRDPLSPMRRYRRARACGRETIHRGRFRRYVVVVVVTYPHGFLNALRVS